YYNFASTSHDGDWKDVNEVVLQDLQEGAILNTGMEVYDAFLDTQVIVVSSLYVVLADNPRHYQLPKFYPPQQTPVDILHRLSLGISKYNIQKAKTLYQKESPTIKSKQLQSAVGKLFSSLSTYKGHHSVTPTQFMRYCSSMNAKDFKAIIQLSPFLYPWFHPQSLCLWASIAALNKFAYDTHYSDSGEQYVLLSQAVHVVIKHMEAFIPEKMEVPKLHLLLHLPQQLLDWVPPSLYVVEVSEHLNGDVRHSIVNSNHHNSSWDTAIDFSTREEILNLLRGSMDAGPQLQQLAAIPSVHKILKLDEALPAKYLINPLNPDTFDNDPAKAPKNLASQIARY
ncbi:hypothetical protein HDU80_002706, partial [Chytriomyces hyalinus]